MTNYDTIIFDMDGTTLDTLEDLAASANYALRKYGYPARSLADIRRFVGNGVTQLMALAIPGGQDNPHFADCLQDFKNYYALNLQNKTAPYAGIPELLAALQAGQYKLAIVSNKLDTAVKQLAAKNFGPYFQVAVGETANVRRKPAPDSVDQALAALKSGREKAVYVGDSEVDVQTARNAGVICVGVTWGFRERAVLEAAGADFIIERPDELLPILASLNSGGSR
jgi:phosphoglycolate phosphatase